MNATYPIKNCSRHCEVVPHSQPIKTMIAKQILQQGTEDAFFIADLSDVVKKHKNWVSKMPRVEPYYAVKCNNDPGILQVLAALGTGFDCASKAEIEQVLSLGVDSSRIVYANPCKMRSNIKYARDENVSKMTFDNEEELNKIKEFYPEAELIIRILPPPSKAVCNLGCKYGVHPEDTLDLLEKAKLLGLNVTGVSFHVGSGCLEAEAFRKAVVAARKVFDNAKLIGYNLDLLDIGGGFPGFYQPDINFDDVTTTINNSINKLFPEGSGIQIIAEPGRYYAASAYTLAANVIAKRKVQPCMPEEQTQLMYYINDGVYGSFNCILYDHADIEVECMKDIEQEKTFPSSLWGPTCDGLDCILPKTQMPRLDVGDWVYFRNMGAYTLAAGSTFNGIPRAKVYHFIGNDLNEIIQVLHQDSVLIPRNE